MTITLAHYLVVGAALFALGVVTVLTRKNAVGLLMGVELILNGANVNFVAFNHFNASALTGQVFSLFTIVLAAAEASVALAIVLSLYQSMKSIDVTEADTLRD